MIGEGKKLRMQFIDKRSYQEAEMDVRSAIDNYEQHIENQLESPIILNKRSHKQSTVIDHSEYKDIVHDLIDWKKLISTI